MKITLIIFFRLAFPLCVCVKSLLGSETYRHLQNTVCPFISFYFVYLSLSIRSKNNHGISSYLTCSCHLSYFGQSFRKGHFIVSCECFRPIKHNHKFVSPISGNEDMSLTIWNYFLFDSFFALTEDPHNSFVFDFPLRKVNLDR